MTRFPEIESEDIRYVYAVARVRALETKLLSPQKVSSLVGLRADELLRLLAETDYATYIPSSPYDYESIIDRARRDLFSLMEKLILDPPVLQFLKARFDNHNIKMGVKVKITDSDPQPFSPYGNLSPSLLSDIFRNELYSRLPHPYEKGIRLAIESYYTTKDPSILDIIIDRSYFGYQRERVVESLFLDSLLKIDIDLTNIKTLLRTKWRKVEKKRWTQGLIEGGFVPLEKFLSAYDDAEENLWERFRYTPYSSILSEGAPPIFRDNSFLTLEKVCDDMFLQFLKKTKFLTFGVEPVIAYFYLKENEFKILRFLFTASIYRIEADLIKQRL